MNKSEAKPIFLGNLDSAAFEAAATKAMRRAQRVAAKENARYGMKLVLERPRFSAKKKAAATP